MGKPLWDWRSELREGRMAGSGKPLTQTQLNIRRMAAHLEDEHGLKLQPLKDNGTYEIIFRHLRAHNPKKGPDHTHYNHNDITDVTPLR
jgi:hypothetical protein